MTTKFIKTIMIETTPFYSSIHNMWIGNRYGIKLENILLLSYSEAPDLYLRIVAELKYSNDIFCVQESTHWRLYKIIK